MVSNLPFYISSPIFSKFLESENTPSCMVIMVQKEVAEKVTAKPGKLNILGISVQLYADVSIEKIIQSSSFWPEPKVEAAILRITPLKTPRFDIDLKIFFRIVKAGFGEKRKQLINSLSGGLSLSKETVSEVLKELSISSSVRAETISLEEWHDIYQKLKVVL